MRLISRYLWREIALSSTFVLAAFLSLFVFMDLIAELAELGKGDYSLARVGTYVVLQLPAHCYEILPIAVLIGALYSMASLAARSETAVMRAAGLSSFALLTGLCGLGVLLASVTLLIGEYAVPVTERLAKQVKLGGMNPIIAQEFRSGVWVKSDRQFVNIGEVRDPRTLRELRVFSFDERFQLQSVEFVSRVTFQEQGGWWLDGIRKMLLVPGRITTSNSNGAHWDTFLTPEMLNVLLVVPERMSLVALYRYIGHLSASQQRTQRHEIAFWRKIFYPLTCIVMLALALPISYVMARSSSVGTKVFLGVMIGVLFHLVNSLLSHVSLLQNWHPLLTGAFSPMAFFIVAMVSLWWVERR